MQDGLTRSMARPFPLVRLYCIYQYTLPTGLKIMARQLLVMMMGQISLNSDIRHFWLNIAGQNGRQGKDLTQQIQILSRHCQVTGRYFKLCADGGGGGVCPAKIQGHFFRCNVLTVQGEAYFNPATSSKLNVMVQFRC